MLTIQHRVSTFYSLVLVSCTLNHSAVINWMHWA